MPGYRKRTTYRRKTYRKKAVSPAIRSLVRSQIRKNERKDHPLQWIDVKWTGAYIKTSPELLSLGNAVANNIAANGAYSTWPLRYDSTNSDNYRQANVFITGFNYQLRFAQNEQAADVTTDSVRCLMYALDDTYQENSTPILDNGDIDQPPRTDDVQTMYMDRVFNLKSQITETTTDDDQFVPDTKIIKGFKKLYHKLVMEERSDSVMVEEGGDIRFEFQSDDNSAVGEVELFGYVRIYYRVMA